MAYTDAFLFDRVNTRYHVEEPYRHYGVTVTQDTWAAYYDVVARNQKDARKIAREYVTRIECLTGRFAVDARRADS